MYIENFWGGRGSSKYYHGYIEGGWGYKSPKNVLRSMWLIPYPKEEELILLELIFSLENILRKQNLIH